MSTAEGPTSTKVRTPAPYISSTTWVKSTGRVACSTRRRRTSSGSLGYGRASAPPNTSTPGGRASTSARKAARGSVTAATRGVWNAAAVRRGVEENPSAASAVASSATASVAPAITTWSGALWLATHTREPGWSPNTAATRSAGPLTASITPGSPGTASISSPRRRAIRSREARSKAPAACRAVTSPKLCPATQSGRRPTERSTRNSAAECAASAGCAHPVAVSRSCRSWSSSSENEGGGKTRSRSSGPKSRSAASSQASRPEERCTARSAPMPTYWLPCPGNRNPTRPGLTAPTP